MNNRILPVFRGIFIASPFLAPLRAAAQETPPPPEEIIDITNTMREHIPEPRARESDFQDAAEPLVFKFAEQMPVFRGDLKRYLSIRIRCPNLAGICDYSGRVILQFIVDTSGTISDIRVLRSTGHPALDEEAVGRLRPMETTAYWKPGRHNRKAVRSYMTLPITFNAD